MRRGRVRGAARPIPLEGTPAAARHHFVFIFALPFLAYLFVAWAGSQAFGWRLPEQRISSKVIGGFLAVWLAFSVLRNLPGAPFTSLYV